ncbi:hypothetical protein ACLBVE_34630, partial [Pseudomonas aeruginosa]
ARWRSSALTSSAPELGSTWEVVTFEDARTAPISYMRPAAAV